MENSNRMINGQLNCVGQELERIPIEFASNEVKRMDLTDNAIKSLDGLKEFESLEELILDRNDLNDDIIATLPRMNSLHTLSLNKNKLSDLDGLLAMLQTRLPKLSYLSLLCNNLCPDQLIQSNAVDDDDYRRYKLYVLYMLPGLKFLDFSAIKASERNEAATKGSFLRVVKPTTQTFIDNTRGDRDEGVDEYRPLPQQLRDHSDTKASFGKCKYVYYGRHSEGNRFIRNNDL